MADGMNLQEQALALGDEDRAAIASALLHSLEPPHYDVSRHGIISTLAA